MARILNSNNEDFRAPDAGQQEDAERAAFYLNPDLYESGDVRGDDHRDGDGEYGDLIQPQI